MGNEHSGFIADVAAIVNAADNISDAPANNT